MLGVQTCQNGNKAFSVLTKLPWERLPASNITGPARALCLNVFTTNCVAANNRHINRPTPRDGHGDKNTRAPRDPGDNGRLVAVARLAGEGSKPIPPPRGAGQPGIPSRLKHVVEKKQVSQRRRPMACRKGITT